MSTLRVLAFSATFGAGHMRAAEAVLEIIQQKNAKAEILHMDFGGLLSKTFTKVIKSTYIEVIKRTPNLWGKLYHKTSHIQSDSMFNRVINGIGSQDFLEIIESFKPDVIICTYPTVAGILGQQRLKRVISVPLVTIVTDYTAHSQWIHPGVDLYIVGSPEVYDTLVARGVSPKRVKITGIPIKQSFEKELDRQAIIDRLGLSADRRTILVMGGAEGILGGAKGICHSLTHADLPIQSIIVCGRDKKLYRSLDDVADKAKNPVLRYSYVHNVEELMTVADLMITKAGGLTVTEALTKRVPLLIYRPIPGQEEQNASFVQMIGAGYLAKSLEELEGYLHELVLSETTLTKMRLAAAGAVPAKAAERAADAILELSARTQKRTKANFAKMVI